MNFFLFDRPGSSELGRTLIRTLLDQGRSVISVTGEQPIPTAHYDVVIDIDSRSATDLRTRVNQLKGCISQYVMVSSFRAYPPVSHLRPWMENEADVCIDLSPRLPPETLACRAMERELQLLAQNRFHITTLRPALLETTDSEEAVTRWFVERVIHGGQVVLPEGDLPMYRQVSAIDLANAVATVAGRPEAFDQIMNVASQATLGYWGHGAVVRDGLRQPLRFNYVPAWRWRAANLRLPLGELAHSAFIEPSSLLHALGWKAEDPITFIMALARQLATSGGFTNHHDLILERRVLADAEAEILYTPGVPPPALNTAHNAPQWVLRAWSGQPASLALERISSLQSLPTPLVKVRALTLTSAEECFLRGEYPQKGYRAIGHNALLEIIDEGTSELARGTLAIPLANLPCGVAACPFCQGGAHTVLGIGCDGYGWGTCTTPPSHLIPVPPGVGHLALLADPLGTLIAAFSDSLTKDQGPIWISGRNYEAALMAWLAADAGRSVCMVDRRAWDHDEFPVVAIEPLLVAVQAGSLERPTLAIDFSGSADVSWPLAQALATGATMYARRRPPGIPAGINWHILPAAAPNRAYLEVAMARLQYWMTIRDVGRRLGPSIPLNLYWDALLPSPFSLPWLEDLQ
jgi:hypothetical protein